MNKQAVPFPSLAYESWVESKETLHLFLQIIGKVRLKAHPKLNHWWHVTLYPAARGLTTGRIPYGEGSFEIFFDMLDHVVRITRHDGRDIRFDAPGKTVAAFHRALFEALKTLDVHVEILGRPYENKSTMAFAKDDRPRAYDIEAVSRYLQAICSIASVFEVFRGRFVGKQTPVQLFWHSFDLVVTRFSGRAYPLEGGTQSDKEAYSHEVISVGFWPGDDSFPTAAFYGYAYPEPEDLKTSPLAPAEALWVDKNGAAMAILDYEDMRQSADPAAALLSFIESLYQGAASKADWPIAELKHDFSS